nr:NAD(P)/FAD-dependent oxidoreductase [Kutzneria albida]
MVTDTEVVVVGAGLAGLAAAIGLTGAGRSVRLVEAAEEVGGRVRTDLLDGFRLDRGFQVLNPAYPAVRDLVDLPALRPGRFLRALRVRDGDHVHLLRLRSALQFPVRDLAALAALSARDLLLPGRWIATAEDRDTLGELYCAGLSRATTERILRPFLSGVLLDADLATSSRAFHLIWRAFLRAAPVLPDTGMAALPRQLADRLPRGTLVTGTPVRHVRPDSVHLADGRRLSCRAVVVATDGSTAASLLPGVREPGWRSVTTLYYRADQPPLRLPVITVDAARGPVVNTLVPSQVAPGYAPAGSSLISASVLGGADEHAVRAHLAQLYGTDTSRWELLAVYPVPRAVPAMTPTHPVRRPVRVRPGLYVCGDHRDTSSIQGALVSGRRTARQVLADL